VVFQSLENSFNFIAIFFLIYTLENKNFPNLFVFIVQKLAQKKERKEEKTLDICKISIAIQVKNSPNQFWNVTSLKKASMIFSSSGILSTNFTQYTMMITDFFHMPHTGFFF
jgi:hypothetical protein